MPVVDEGIEPPFSARQTDVLPLDESTSLFTTQQSGRQESNLPEAAYQTAAFTAQSTARNRVPGGLRPRIVQPGQLVPFSIGHRYVKQRWKDLNPLREFWRLAALPGAHLCQHSSLRSVRLHLSPTFATGRHPRKQDSVLCHHFSRHLPDHQRPAHRLRSIWLAPSEVVTILGLAAFLCLVKR